MAYTTQQMTQYQRIRRATLAGFRIKRALAVYNAMTARGVDICDARAAVMAAARDGLFGIMQR